MSEAERAQAPSPLTGALSGALSGAGWLDVLATGEIEIEGRLPWSSNYSFLVSVTKGDTVVRAVYKPGRGERYLWDFGEALYRREVAAYEFSRAVGLIFVPETVLRTDAPLEEGSLQRFIDADFTQHYFTMMEASQHQDQLRELAGLDLLMNNADRKAGHVLVDGTDRGWGIDHGLCFHEDPKLRTVMWDFAGETLPECVIAAAEVVASSVPEALRSLVSPEASDAMRERARGICKKPKFPAPRHEYRSYPWPLV